LTEKEEKRIDSNFNDLVQKSADIKNLSNDDIMNVMTYLYTFCAQPDIKLSYRFSSNVDNTEITNSVLNKNIDKFVNMSNFRKENDMKFRNILSESTLGLPSIGIFDNVFKNIDTTDNIQIKNRRLLTTTNHLVLPVNVLIKFLVTSSDVLHSWAVPNLGIKMDAVPGRLNATQVFITAPGEFIGQCSELCGPSHYSMPITVRAVSYDEYKTYLGFLSKKRN